MRLPGAMTVSRLILASDLPSHFSNFYRFFGRATWCRQQVAQSLLEVTFRDFKQEVGFGHYRLRKEIAFTRYLQLTLVAHAILRLTSLQDGVTAMTTPWYDPTGIPSIAQTKAMLRRGEDHMRFFTILARMPISDEIRKEVARHYPAAA